MSIKNIFNSEVRRKESKEIHAKLKVINDSNSPKLSKLQTKNVSRESFLFAVSLIRQIRIINNLSTSNQMTIASFKKILS